MRTETLDACGTTGPDPSGPRAASTCTSTTHAILRGRGVPVVDWEGWLRIDAAEQRLGAASGRERTKIVDRSELVALGAGVTV